MSRANTLTRHSAGIAAALLIGLPPAIGAQATDARRAPTVVTVRVADSLGLVVPDAEVTLMRGLKEMVASARTNASGEHEFIVDLDSTDYSIVARKIGFARGDRFFSVARAAVNVDVVMKRVGGDLPAVVISEAEDLRRRSYHMDADQIAAADIPLHDALDIVERLRPDMIISRSGTWGGRTHYGCPSMQNIWVNGRRYDNAFTIVDATVVMRAKGARNRPARIGAGNMTTLSEIAPEHIAEMNYRDCFDTTERRIGTTNALFIVLKPGVAYRPGSGTFVVGDTARVALAK